MKLSKKEYSEQLYKLQVELVKFQRHCIKEELKVCILFEGRDSAGKDGTIKRFIEHLSPREARIAALGRPSDKERKSWYFQRFVPHLPSSEEMVFFNRSWYNRAGVEKVMKFCTKKEYTRFMEEVEDFEHLLVHSGILFFKYYLDISKKEQKKRLDERKRDPLKQWKVSCVDEKAQLLWEKYSLVRDEMLSKTHFSFAKWTIIKADNKKIARLNAIKNFLSRVDYPDKDEKTVLYDPNIVFDFDPGQYKNGLIAP
ncbi:MAG: polyphosphate kinase 2 [Campylobacterota bacterium]|nr:polyphosphate kinase 2 [Campylobacterota bacterium]